MGCRSATLRGRCRARVTRTGTFNPTLREKPGRAGEGWNPRAVGHSQYEEWLILRQQESNSGAQIPFPNAASCNFPPWNHEKVATSIIPSSVVLRNYLGRHRKG